MPAQPHRWSDGRLDADRRRAIEDFREERLSESLGVYLDNFEHYRDAVENLLEATVDLTELAEQATDVLLDADLRYAARYVAGPPISVDDIQLLSQASLSPSHIRNDPDGAKRVIETILLGLDRERFPWVAENREATEDERRTAVIASAALIASQRVRTSRANESPARQQELVGSTLSSLGLVEESAREIPNVSAAPPPGHFCGESLLGTRKADVVVRVWDGRILAIECKVSNSEVNSIKRLTNDAVVKARTWRREFGEANIVPGAVLAGVFGVRHLKEAQNDLSLFWSHSIHELTAFIETTREGLPHARA